MTEACGSFGIPGLCTHRDAMMRGIDRPRPNSNQIHSAVATLSTRPNACQCLGMTQLDDNVGSRTENKCARTTAAANATAALRARSATPGAVPRSPRHAPRKDPDNKAPAENASTLPNKERSASCRSLWAAPPTGGVIVNIALTPHGEYNDQPSRQHCQNREERTGQFHRSSEPRAESHGWCQNAPGGSSEHTRNHVGRQRRGRSLRALGSARKVMRTISGTPSVPAASPSATSPRMAPCRRDTPTGHSASKRKTPVPS